MKSRYCRNRLDVTYDRPVYRDIAEVSNAFARKKSRAKVIALVIAGYILTAALAAWGMFR